MPILSRRKYLALRSLEEFVIKEEKLSFIPEKEQLQDAVKRLVASAQQAIDDGATIFVLTDEGIDEAHACIPALLAVGAVHTALVRDGTRMQISLVVGLEAPGIPINSRCFWVAEPQRLSPGWRKN